MKGFLALTGKEMRALFLSPIAWALIAVFLFLMGYSFTMTLFGSRNATLVHIFFQAAALLLLIVPIVTMRAFAEERRNGTLELLLTAPIREGHLVLAKYLAAVERTDPIKYVGRVTKVLGILVESRGPQAVIGEVCQILVPRLGKACWAEVEFTVTAARA